VTDISDAATNPEYSYVYVTTSENDTSIKPAALPVFEIVFDAMFTFFDDKN